MLPLLLAVAHAATWPFRAPVPAAALTDGAPFALCLELGVPLGFDGADASAGNVGYRCVDDERSSRVCYQVSMSTEQAWPERWPTLECRGTDTRVVVQLFEAFHPRADLSRGVVIHRSVDQPAAVFEVGNTYQRQKVEGTRGTLCEVADGKLFVSRRGGSRRRDWCELRRRDGTIERMSVRFRSRIPAPAE
jgi:hypothetical protein